MLSEQLQNFVDLIKDPDLRNDIRTYLSFYSKDLLIVPGSINYHHNNEGGLLEHLLEVADLCLSISEILERTYGIVVNNDYLLASALIHDIGKIKEYYYNENYRQWKYKRLPYNMSHSLYPILDFQIKMKKNLPVKIQIMILTHMGGWEDNIIECNDLETSILHAADLLSSRLETLSEEL